MSGIIDSTDRPCRAARAAGLFGELVARMRGGDLGSLPVIVGLVVIWAVVPDR